MVRNFMSSQEAKLSKLEAQFRQQQVEMNNKINDLLKVAHAQFATAPTEEVKSISATPPSSQTYPPVKIKHPSKLFKPSSPRNKTITDHPLLALSISSTPSPLHQNLTEPTTITQPRGKRPMKMK